MQIESPSLSLFAKMRARESILPSSLSRCDTIAGTPSSISFSICAARCFEAHSAEWRVCLRLLVLRRRRRKWNEHNSLYTFSRQTHASLDSPTWVWQRVNGLGGRGQEGASLCVYAHCNCLPGSMQRAPTSKGLKLYCFYMRWGLLRIPAFRLGKNVINIWAMLRTSWFCI